MEPFIIVLDKLYDVGDQIAGGIGIEAALVRPGRSIVG
jgi:hypothetical protein